MAWGPNGLVGRWAGVHESPLIGETAVIGRGGTTSRARGGWSRMIMMATKMRRDSIFQAVSARVVSPVFHGRSVLSR